MEARDEGERVQTRRAFVQTRRTQRTPYNGGLALIRGRHGMRYLLAIVHDQRKTVLLILLSYPITSNIAKIQLCR